MGEALQFRVLGRVEVVDRSGTELRLGGPKRQAVLARLLLDANRPVPFDRLVEDLWDGDPTPGAHATLQSHISRLRRAVGADRLRTVDGGYLLSVEAGELDAATAEAELATARRLLGGGSLQEAVGVLETALDRWRGPPFGELCSAAWATAEATRLEDVRLQAVEALLAARLALGEPADVAARAEKEISVHPLRERLWALLIEALYRDRRQADALRAYQRLRATLVEELGIEPSPELRSLEQLVLAQGLPPVGDAVEPSATHPLVAPARDEAPPRRRTTVTVVFAHFDEADTPGARDPESTRDVIVRYHKVLGGEIAHHGGRVLSATSEGVLAVFGVPDMREDDAERAVLAAHAMGEAASKVSAELRAALQASMDVSVGVEAGEVVLEGDDIVGDAVRTATRLAAAGGPGQTLVGEAVWRLTRHVATFEGAAPLERRGRTESLAAYRLLATTTSADASATALFGRDPELEALVALFDTVASRRVARMATVIGSPGVGKTRLASELCAAVDGRVTVLASRCDPTGATALGPIADLIGDLGPLDDLIGGEPERDRIAAVVDGLLGGGPPGTPEETFWAVRRLIEAAAAHRPVLVVLDDLHWAEPLLLDLVEHLAEWITDRPVLLLAAARPELRELRPALAEAARRGSVVMALEGLDAVATEQLACELLGAEQVPAELVTTLMPATQGNPLFVRELVRMLVEDRVLQPDDSSEGWRLTIDPGTVDVPPTIQAMLAARVDRLGSDERTVLERAAVIGTELYRGLLAELVPAELRPGLDTVLESLRRKELLEPAGSYWIDQRVLRFHHVLIRDAAYRRLLRDARAELHERSALWIEAKTGGGVEHDELIGYHLEQAQTSLRALGPLDERGRAVADEAAVRLASAARRALDRDDLATAAALAGRGVGCLDVGDARRAELSIVRCEALLGEGSVAESDEALVELTAHVRDDDRLQAWTTCFAVQRAMLVDPRSIGDSEEDVVDAAERLAALGDPAGAAKAHRVHASVLGRLGRFGDCEAALDRALSAAREADDRRQITGVLSVAPLAALWGPSPVPRAGGRCLDVIRLARVTTGAAVVEATSIRCQAVLEAMRGRFDRARDLVAEARAAAEELGHRHGSLEVELFAGIIELWGDEPAAAADRARLAHDGFRAMGVDADAAQAAALRARAALALGADDDALAFAATSKDLGGQDLKIAIAWRAVRAEVLARRGSLDEATELAEAAAAMAERTDALVDHADACAALCAVKRSGGDDAAAAAAAARARALYEQKGATALAARFASAAEVAEPPLASSDLASRATRVSDVLENDAVQVFRRLSECVHAGRIDDAATILAPDYFDEDRRFGLGNRNERDTVLQQYGFATQLGIRTLEENVLAVRGERLALIRQLVGTDQFEAEVMMVYGSDGAGQAEFAILFDPSDVVGALAEMDQRFTPS